MFTSWRKSKPVPSEADRSLPIPQTQFAGMVNSQLTELAQAGNAQAMFCLAVRLQGAIEGKADLLEGKRWLERAAESGDSRAMRRLAHMCLIGGGGEQKDLARASAWAIKAYNAGSAWGMFWMGYIHVFEQPDASQAKRCFSEAHRRALAGAHQGDTESIICLAALLAEEWCSHFDPAGAAEWCRKAALQGNAYAMESLALMYDEGRGVRQDSTLARIWLTRAVDRNWLRAATPLAKMLLRGEGGPPDRDTAAELLKKAAAAGDESAIVLLRSNSFVR